MYISSFRFLLLCVFELLHFSPDCHCRPSMAGCVIVFQEGRTPLHYAAALQGTTGGANRLFNLLLDSGADENIVDVVRPDVIYLSTRDLPGDALVFYAEGFLCQMAGNAMLFLSQIIACNPQVETQIAQITPALVTA